MKPWICIVPENPEEEYLNWINLTNFINQYYMQWNMYSIYAPIGDFKLKVTPKCYYVFCILAIRKRQIVLQCVFVCVRSLYYYYFLNNS